MLKWKTSFPKSANGRNFSHLGKQCGGSEGVKCQQPWSQQLQQRQEVALLAQISIIWHQVLAAWEQRWVRNSSQQLCGLQLASKERRARTETSRQPREQIHTTLVRSTQRFQELSMRKWRSSCNRCGKREKYCSYYWDLRPHLFFFSLFVFVKLIHISL